MVRAGKHGEDEQRFLHEGKIYLTWNDLNYDLSKAGKKAELRKVLTQIYPNASKGRITNHLGQVWGYSHGIEKGDWIVLPSKHKAAIHVGKATGDYTYNAGAENPYYHSRTVDWFATDIPRSSFDQDLLYSLGAFMSVCRIKRNNAEARIHAMAEAGWKPQPGAKPIAADDATDDDVEATADLEQIARDQIAKLI